MMDELGLIDDLRQSLALSVASGVLGGLMGGVHGSMRTVRLGMPIARPASLFAFYTFSCMTFRSASKHARHRHSPPVGTDYSCWKDTMVGVGWSTVIFGRALTGRPWILVLPAALTTATLVTAIEFALPSIKRVLLGSLAVNDTPTQVQHIPSMNWVQRRWERIALMESRLHSLNQEIAQLSQNPG